MPTETPSIEPIPACPRCHATHVVRNGTIQYGLTTFLCRGCNRRFVVAPKRAPISVERWHLVRKLLPERLSPRTIARATGVSRTWL
ncbi:IS1 family transposase [Isosphaeraceae bacterium EP7]